MTPSDGFPEWVYERPAPTVVGTRRSSDGMLIGRQLAGSDRRDNGGKSGDVGISKYQLAGVRVTKEEAAILQSYPSHLPPAPVFRNGNQRNAAKRSLDQPAPTIMFGARSNKVEWMDPALADDPAASGPRVSPEEAAILQSYPTHLPESRMKIEEIMALVPEGGNWNDLPIDLLEEAMGGAYKSGGGKTGYFRRLNSQTPSPTIVGSPSQKSTLLWHPTENRPINEDEASALQTYPSHLKAESVKNSDLVALDLFAGTGWGVACRWLGIEEHGVDIMPEVVATREANGMSTIYNDVWDGLLGRVQGNALDIINSYNTLIASPPCFAAGTPVLTFEGVKPIEKVEVGDLVWTHKNRWRTVTNTMSRESETIRIKEVVTTPDHPFYARHQTRKWDNERRTYIWNVADEQEWDDDNWIPAGESQGSFWATPLRVQGNLTIPPLAERNAWLAGRYVADGWTGRDGVMLAIGDGTEEPEGEWAISQVGPRCRRFTRADHDLASWLKVEFGHGAENKTIPTWVFKMHRVWREDFLRGYISGDGTKTQSGHRAVTVSAALASQLRLLAVSLGLTSSVGYVKTPDTTIIEGRAVSQADYYTVSFNENDGRYTRDKDGFRWTKQRKEPVSEGVQTVYDITVDEDHSFTAWGYIVHNCQTFSQAGSGAGRKALDQVIAAVVQGRYKDPEDLHKLSEETDPRTALVLTPLAYAYRDRPTYIVLEQVPPVLPVWEAIAVELRNIGYSVVTGHLHAEQYGVPQTRKRAILIARNDGQEAVMPVPSHSKYYSRDPKRLDQGVLPWVTMAKALGWDKPSSDAVGISKAVQEGEFAPEELALNSNVRYGRGTVRASDEPAPTITGGKDYDDRKFVLRSNYGTSGDPENRGERDQDQPAATITSKAARNKWVARSSQSVAGDPRITAREHHYHGEQNSTSYRLEQAEAERLQSYPEMVWVGNKGRVFLMLGNAVPPLLAHAILSTLITEE